MNVEIEMPVSLTAIWEGWVGELDGSAAVVIRFGTVSLAVIPTPQFDGFRAPTPDDADVSEIAAAWLRDRLNIPPI